MGAKLRVVFMGSPEFAVPTLAALHARHQVTLVVSQPDKPAGRGQRVQPPAVVEYARAQGLRVIQPPRINDPGVIERLRAERADAFVVVAYGKILPQSVLDLPRLGCINVHGSILPRHRGAAPIQWAVISGDAETGVTIMQMDAGMDTGPIYLVRRLPIGPDDTAGSLYDKLAPLGAAALIEALDGIAAGTLSAVPQPAQGATVAPRLSKADGVLDFERPALEVANRARGVDPWPGAVACWRGETIKLFGARVVDLESTARPPPGALGSARDRLVVACGDGRAVGFAEIQRPGKKRLPARDVLAGRPIEPGERLSRVELADEPAPGA